jgi:iron complex outermembrane receptor protein
LNAAGAAGPTFADLRLDAHTASVWVEDRWRAAPGLLVHAGVAFLWAGREGRGEPQPAQGKSGYEAAAPRLEVAWLGGERTSIRLFAAVARGVEAPSFDDLLAVSGPPGGLALAWNPLRHQSADTIELGGRGRAGPLEYEVTVYASSWDDELLRLADSNGAPRGTVNAGPTRHRGIEAGLRWRMHDADRRTLDLALNHTLTDARFADDPVFSDNRIGGVPRHLGGAGLTYRDERGPFAVLGATWVADTVWVDHGNSLGYEGHVLLNGRFGWQSAGGWTIALEIDNMLDRNHIASSAGVLDLARAGDATSIFLPGSPRLARISVERRW